MFLSWEIGFSERGRSCAIFLRAIFTGGRVSPAQVRREIAPLMLGTGKMNSPNRERSVSERLKTFRGCGVLRDTRCSPIHTRVISLDANRGDERRNSCCAERIDRSIDWLQKFISNIFIFIFYNVLSYLFTFCKCVFIFTRQHVRKCE